MLRIPDRYTILWMPIITDSVLDEAKAKKIATSLHRIARDRDAFRRYLEQINSIWDSMPSSLQNKLGGMLKSNSEGNYRGAIAEIFSFWALSSLLGPLNPDLNINGKTPDFGFSDGQGNQLIFETFCIGKDGGERMKDKYFADLQQEMDGYESVLKIHLHGSPRPNAKQNIRGLGQKVGEYLNTLDPRNISPGVHHVECNGANVFFRVQVTNIMGPVVWGFVDNGSSGNPQAEILKSELKEKSEKYPFQFVAVAVADLAIWGAVLTLLESELRNFADNLMGVLFISVGIRPPGGEVRLTLHLIEHPHSKGFLKLKFPDVPDVEDPAYEGQRHLMPGLEMIPHPTGL